MKIECPYCKRGKDFSIGSYPLRPKTCKCGIKFQPFDSDDLLSDLEGIFPEFEVFFMKGIEKEDIEKAKEKLKNLEYKITWHIGREKIVWFLWVKDNPLQIPSQKAPGR